MSQSLISKTKRLAVRLEETFPVAVIRRFVEIDLLTHAASLSFFALISLAPLLVLVLWVAASLYPEAQQALIDQIGELAGDEARAVALTVIRNASEQPDVGSLAGIWSTLLLFIGATAVFAQLQATLNRIFSTGDDSFAGVFAWLRRRVFTFGVVFALGFLILVSTLLTTVVELLFSDLPALLPVAGNAVMLAVYTVAFALIYRYVPDRRAHWRQAFLGGLITSALFLLGRWGIGLYIGEAAPGSAYGSMGTLVILIVWMYYAAMIFFVGALITAVIDERITARAARAAAAAPATAAAPDTLAVTPEPGTPAASERAPPPAP